MAYQPKKQQNASRQADVEFVKGMSVKHQETRFGDIIKVGINVEEFLNNEPNDKGFINLEIKKSKKGEYFAVLTKPLDK